MSLAEDVMDAIEEQVAAEAAATAITMSNEAHDINLAVTGEMSDTNPDNEPLDDETLDRMMGEKVSFDLEVENFLRSLYDDIYDRRIEAIRRLYEVDYPAISEKYFANSPWPSVESVSAFYHQYQRYHSLIITLYKELYYRHFYLKCGDELTWNDRQDSWKNYSLLMNYLIEVECAAHEEGKENKSLRLPIQWIFDILDEFVYQFQEACRYRQRCCRQMPEDEQERERVLAELDRESDVWKPSQVYELLHALVLRSDTNTYLKQAKEDPSRIKQIEGEFHFQLGYFAILQLLKLHVQLGAFYEAIDITKNVDISSKGLYWKVPFAHVIFLFHLGFAYMMLRRYNDTIRILSQFLIFIARQRSYLQATASQQASMLRLVDRMHILVMLCSNICNVKLDESLTQTIKDKYVDKYYKVQQESEDAYYEAFTFACPKFICVATPPISDPVELANYANAHSDMQLRVCKVFLKEVENRKRIGTIQSFAKLYNNIQLGKLASLMDLSSEDSVDQVTSEILAAKYHSQQKIWRSGSLLSGEVAVQSSEQGIEFYIVNDMIHVKAQQSHKVYVDHFLKQIERSEILLRYIHGSHGQKEKRQGDNRTYEADTTKQQQPVC